MAKYKKMMPPRNTVIRGQDHLLAYITPEEAALLKARGGTGEAGPMGIPAFVADFSGEEGDDFSSGSYGNDDGSLGGDGGGRDNSDARSRAVEKDYGTSSPTKEQIEKARGFDVGSDASNALIAQIQGGYGGKILGDKYAGSGFENQMFFDQLPGRLANAQAGYGLPGFLGAGAGALGTYMLNKMRDQVLAGGLPAFSAAVPSGGLTGYGNRTFRGVFTKGPFGLDVYTGMPIEGNELTGWSPDDFGGGPDDVKPVNPVTGQCDAGYIFDEDLQACRLDTGGAGTSGPVGTTFAPGAYARMGLLDVAPTGLPDFYQRYGVPSQDFNEANLAFRRGTATQSGIFQDPYDLTGYTLLG